MKKFTLIELLIVVAIIGILVSMLMPSLQKARLKAQSAVCKSNLKNIGNAAMMYTDKKGYLPWSQQYFGNSSPHVWWRRQTLTFLGTGISEPLNSNSDKYRKEIGEGVFVCPNEKTGMTHFAKGGYGWNLKYMGWGLSSHPNPSPKLLDNIDQPSETILAGDGTDDESAASYTKNMLLPPSLSGLQGTRHFLGANLLWADGHVSLLKTPSLQAGRDGDTDYFYKLEK